MKKGFSITLLSSQSFVYWSCCAPLYFRNGKRKFARRLSRDCLHVTL